MCGGTSRPNLPSRAGYPHRLHVVGGTRKPVIGLGICKNWFEISETKCKETTDLSYHILHVCVYI